MPNRLNGQVDVEIGPVQMVGRGKFDVQNLADRDIAKPRKFGERQKQFFIGQQQPEAMLRNIGYFNLGSACAKRYGCHFHAPEPGGLLH